MVDRVIDTGETESRQREDPLNSLQSTYTYTCTLASHLDFLQTLDPALPIPIVHYMTLKQRKCITLYPRAQKIHI